MQKSYIIALAMTPFLISGCKTTSADRAQLQDAATTTSGTAQAPGALSVQVAAADNQALSVAVAPGFSSTDDGGAFGCEATETTADGERLTCKRGPEILWLLHHVGRQTLVLDYAPGGVQSDQRFFYRCDGAERPLGAAGQPFSCNAAKPVDKVNGKFVSPFPSDADAPRIRNGHVVAHDSDGQPLIFRGMLPLATADFQELAKHGVESVLIYKTDDTGHDVADEKAGLSAASDKITTTHVPFPWKEFHGDFTKPCLQTIDALIAMRDAAKAHRRLFFHCTVGEDRTGFLAGLYRMMDESQRWGAARAFHDELCENGFAAGDAKKPYTFVVNPINEALTPLFVEMAPAIESGHITKDNLETTGREFCATVAPKPLAADRQAPWGGSIDCPPSIRYLPNLDEFQW